MTIPSGTLSAIGGSLGNLAGGNSGFLIVNGGAALNFTAGLNIGAGSFGSMSVAGPGTSVLTADTLVGLGTWTGALVVQSGASYVASNTFLVGAFNVAGSGNGSVSVSGGSTMTNAVTGLAGNGAATTGQVDLSGGGSTWTTTLSFGVGGDGQGTFTVSSGAALNTFGASSIIGGLFGSVGTIRVTGVERRGATAYSP